MKAVMISIRPEWCEKIASGKKSIEVRKTKPKLETPFKCYIYCTIGFPMLWKDEKIFIADSKYKWLHFTPNPLNGKVIGEFVCDAIVVDKTFGHDRMLYTAACMTPVDIAAYCVNSEMYGWHISELKIYDKPKDIRQFTQYSEKDIRPCMTKKSTCHHESYDFSENTTICDIDYDGSHCPFIRLKKPPQSWCYVEGVYDNG